MTYMIKDYSASMWHEVLMKEHVVRVTIDNHLGE